MLRIVWVTGSTGDMLQQIAGIEIAFRNSRSKSLDIVITPSWCSSLAELLTERRTLISISLPKAIHNFLTVVLRRHPSIRPGFFLIPSHFENPDILDLDMYNRAMNNSSEIISFALWEVALRVVDKRFPGESESNDRKIEFKPSKRGIDRLVQFKRVYGERQFVLLCPISHTHIGFAPKVWLKICETIASLELEPVISIGKSISRKSFAFKMITQIRKECRSRGIEIHYSEPLDVMLLSRLSVLSVSSLGGSTDLIHNFYLDSKLGYGREDRSLIISSRDESRYSPEDRREKVFRDYHGEKMESQLNRHSSKDISYRSHLELKRRDDISEDELTMVHDIISKKMICS